MLSAKDKYNRSKYNPPNIWERKWKNIIYSDMLIQQKRNIKTESFVA